MYLLTILALVLPCLAYPLTIRQLSGTVENDVINGVCKAVTVIFARGTVEIGNAGIIAGPPFFMALSNAIGANNLAVQGIDYPADFIGFFEGGDNGGSATMASLAAQAVAQCPQTQIVLSGYSQGAQLVHKAAGQLSGAAISAFKAAVVFGDPDNGQPVAHINAANVKTFCAEGDLICQGDDIVLPPHLSYGLNAQQAASFVKSKITS